MRRYRNSDTPGRTNVITMQDKVILVSGFHIEIVCFEETPDMEILNMYQYFEREYEVSQNVWKEHRELKPIDYGTLRVNMSVNVGIVAYEDAVDRVLEAYKRLINHNKKITFTFKKEEYKTFQIKDNVLVISPYYDVTEASYPLHDVKMALLEAFNNHSIKKNRVTKLKKDFVTSTDYQYHYRNDEPVYGILDNELGENKHIYKFLRKICGDDEAGMIMNIISKETDEFVIKQIADQVSAIGLKGGIYNYLRSSSTSKNRIFIRSYGSFDDDCDDE